MFVSTTLVYSTLDWDVTQYSFSPLLLTFTNLKDVPGLIIVNFDVRYILNLITSSPIAPTQLKYFISLLLLFMYDAIFSETFNTCNCMDSYSLTACKTLYYLKKYIQESDIIKLLEYKTRAENQNFCQRNHLEIVFIVNKHKYCCRLH